MHVSGQGNMSLHDIWYQQSSTFLLIVTLILLLYQNGDSELTASKDQGKCYNNSNQKLGSGIIQNVRSDIIQSVYSETVQNLDCSF
jgi:hypothetical protein